ncbi:hypothetical protein FB451DRAFT_589068 [Mycena latifolia]|nr:hypothetical protein FB451DRAFT_589068 [Mycena latifolia]
MLLNPAFSTLTQQDKIDFKRASGKAPCAECKRLKLKCDKNIPCASCIRRGCDGTCPTGTYLPTGRGRRAVPTEAARLRRAMSGMEDRIKELETAITSACEYHLDHCALLGISSAEASSSADQLAERVGTLSVNDTGDSQYFGPTAGTEALLSIEPNDPVLDQATSTFAAVTDAFSLGGGKTIAWKEEQALAQLFIRLPSKPRAWQLCEVYFENGCWSGTPIMRAELIELLSRVYGRAGAPDPNFCSPHQMSVLYGVFALGALVDLTLPPYSAESEYYFDLCRAALSVHSIFDSPSAATVQALVLVSIFHSHGGPRFSMDGGWSIISLASTICQNMGLHTGRLSPGLSPTEFQRQRALFWETYSIETLQSLAMGRPTGTCLANISCPFPTDEDQQIDDTGGIRDGYYRRRWQFIKEIAAPVMEMYLTAHPPAYDVVVDLDQRIRKFMHATTCTDLHSEDQLLSPSVYIQRKMIHQSCTIMLLYIHNDAFVQAMRENPTDPYYTSRATSFLSANRYASEIIRAAIDNVTRHPELFARWWTVWKSLFNAAIIVGAIAAKCPETKFAPQALLELFVAVDLFERGAASSFRARSALTVLRTLRDKATAAYTKHSGHALGSEAPAPPDAESDAALDVFAGRTRIVAQSILARDQCRHHAPQVYPAPPGTEGAPPASADAIDASLVHYFARPPKCAGAAKWLDIGVASTDRANPGGDLAEFPPSSFLDVPLWAPGDVEDTEGLPAYFLAEPQLTEFLRDL